jgi:hypothetical protein
MDIHLGGLGVLFQRGAAEVLLLLRAHLLQDVVEQQDQPGPVAEVPVDVHQRGDPGAPSDVHVAPVGEHLDLLHLPVLRRTVARHLTAPEAELELVLMLLLLAPPPPPVPSPLLPPPVPSPPPPLPLPPPLLLPLPQDQNKHYLNIL